MRKIAIVVALVAISFGARLSHAQFPAAPGTGPGLAETVEAIDSARVTTRILYVTAHPDDERADVLTYLARGLHADVALLSLTRGEGGQNALGPEQAPQLGLIRTQELLAATRGYGVKLYFTRAKDFGYSKTPEETEKIWGDQVVEDMVRVIRTFRPNIVINNWGGVHTGHGHHQAAGLLTPIAVQRAADANAYPEQLKEGLGAWGGTKNEVVILDMERSEKPTGYVLPLDEVSPLWGKTWREIGLDAFANHRTQGVPAFLGSPFFRRPLALKRENGGAFSPESLAQPLSKLLDADTCRAHTDWCQKLVEADNDLDKARASALQLQWKDCFDLTSKAELSIKSLYKPDRVSSRGPLSPMQEDEVRHAADRIVNALLLVSGFHFVAEGNRASVAAHENFEVTARFACRPEVTCPVEGGSLDGTNEKIDPTKGTTGQKLEVTAEGSSEKNVLNLQAEGAPDFSASLYVGTDPNRATIRRFPVVYTAAETTHVERVPVRIVPAYTLAVEPKQTLELVGGERKEFDVFLRIHSYSTKAAKVAVGMNVPVNWVYNGPFDLNFSGDGDHYVKFTVTPPAGLVSGNYPLKAFAMAEGARFTTSIEPLPSMPTLVWEEPAQTVVHAFDIKVPENLRVGYISAESEPVPEALRMLGIHVDLLDANALNFGDLSKYDAIVVGVRAYELRGELPGANQRLLDYAKNGGTLVVQYERDFAWDGKSYAPYPAKIASKPGDPLPRITDETSPVKFLKPDDSLLNTPNKITQEDFKGWVQERGLYFWSDFDSRYTPLLAMNDPGEKDLDGALVYAKYGKGTYIYTGIAFFRQLPEGVPGAYRLFVNLLSASRSH
ncbi:MAG: PIG-L family deacetylase [Acidobacteria bacterium]|nr:PIG-L family deacetylase [Acidobacteriota bacterium]MBS1864522.1 PIG-L family deacetylase [Acidobacteriota bacterium]